MHFYVIPEIRHAECVAIYVIPEIWHAECLAIYVIPEIRHCIFSCFCAPGTALWGSLAISGRHLLCIFT